MGTVISYSFLDSSSVLLCQLDLYFIPTRHLLFCQALRGWSAGQSGGGGMWRLKASVWSESHWGLVGAPSLFVEYMAISKLDLYRYGTRLASKRRTGVCRGLEEHSSPGSSLVMVCWPLRPLEQTPIADKAGSRVGGSG